MRPVTVTGLHVYPVKSCRGIALRASEVEERGLRYDRRWMLVDSHGVFLTQRQHHRLALVGVHLDADGLRLSAPGREELRIPVDEGNGDRVSVRIWNDTVQAALVGHGSQQWFSAFLGFPTRLVFMPEDVRRPVDPRYAAAGAHTGFSDAFPVLLISEASLEDLNRRLSRPVPMNRFRPNIVVGGCAAYAEDTWKTLIAGTLRIRIVKPCARCVITTVDQATAQTGSEPLTTLEQYRKQGQKVLFGQNVVVEGTGSIRAGDVVTTEESENTA